LLQNAAHVFYTVQFHFHLRIWYVVLSLCYFTGWS